MKTEFSDYCTIAINCADLKVPEKETVKNMIESLWKKIGIEESTYSDYTQLSSSKQEWVIADVISNSKTGMLPKDVAEQFRKSVNEAKNKKNTGGTSGGGGGGGSSSSGFSAGTAANTTVEPQKTAGKFTDLESVSWAEEAINTLAKYDVINGKSENIFAPNDYIKREEFAQLIVKSFNIPSGTQELKFEDVSKDAWYYDSLKKAFSNGIINGMSETKFGTGEFITRQDMAVMLYRAAAAAGVEILVVDAEKTVNDSADISEYAADAVAELVKAGIINGDQNRNFNPKNNATRAQAAVMIYNLLYK